MKKSILLIEDEPLIIKMIEMVLDDYEFFVSTDGLSGFNKACELKPHIILLDLTLPVLKGYEVIEKLKNCEETAHIPVIALSARKLPLSELLEKGFSDYQEKPFMPDVLLEKIEKNLSN